MSKNKKVVSIAMEPELHEQLKQYSKRKGESVSSYVGMLVNKSLKLNVDDEPIIVGKPIEEDVLPVVLMIPANLKGNSSELASWLNDKMKGIYKKLS